MTTTRSVRRPYAVQPPLTEGASPLSRVTCDYGHSHAVAQRGENANEKITRHVFEIVVQNSSHPDARRACPPRNLRVSDLCRRTITLRCLSSACRTCHSFAATAESPSAAASSSGVVATIGLSLRIEKLLETFSR